MKGPFIHWAVAQAPLGGYHKSGDCYVAQPFPDGVLVAVLDGLGHGDGAAAAAKTAASILEARAQDSVTSLLQRCHEALRGTRGVVISLASFNELQASMTWAGVGNVEGILLRGKADATPKRESLLLRAGVVGSQLPALKAATISVAAGDTLIFTTDGIRHDFSAEFGVGDSLQQIADRILAAHGKDDDDALVLVARCAEGNS